jgi:hypothetical protein
VTSDKHRARRRLAPGGSRPAAAAAPRAACADQQPGAVRPQTWRWRGAFSFGARSARRGGRENGRRPDTSAMATGQGAGNPQCAREERLVSTTGVVSA